MSLYKNEELKEAVLNLPPREKDKLLIRLINKDKLLIKQLHYRLLENEEDLSRRIETLKNNLNKLANKDYFEIENSLKTSNINNQISLLRQQNMLINEHEKVTKDVFSAVECRLLTLETAFTNNAILFQRTELNSTIKLRKYISTQLRITFNKFDKLHEDLQFDLKDSYELVMTFAEQHDLR